MVELNLPQDGELNWDVKLNAALQALNDGKAEGLDITSALNAHIIASDPHGDRASATADIAASAAAHVAAQDPHGDRADAASKYLPLTGGGRVIGKLAIDKYGAPAGYPVGPVGSGESFSILSSYAGGDDDGTGTDSTGRLNLYSYQRANSGSFGETIRHHLMRSDAKAMEAWYMPKNGYDGNRNPNPGSWQPVAWTGAHFESNSHTGLHAHWELEIPDSTGALQGRLEAPFANQATGAIGLDKTQLLTNLADFVVRCHGTSSTGTDIQQVLRLQASAGFEKALDFSNDTGGTLRRFKLRVTGEAETGSNAGSNFQVMRYDDTGTAIDQPFMISRASGAVTIGGTTGTAGGLVINRNGGIGLQVFPLATGGAGIGVTGADVTARILQGDVTADPNRRFVILADGKSEWGSGIDARDTNLYRSSVGVLKTDYSFHVTQNFRINTTSVGAGVGVIGIGNATTVPAGNPNGGGVIYVEAGALKYRGSNGTITQLAAA